ncbi:MAG: hypothetical protein R3183_04480 [Oleiphilaceae bacterium]|nr:hypothetical protein [Oleiphilaceae bacterium]
MTAFRLIWLVLVVGLVQGCSEFNDSVVAGDTLLVIPQQAQNLSYDSWARKYHLVIEYLDAPTHEQREIWLNPDRHPIQWVSGLAPGKYRLKQVEWSDPNAWLNPRQSTMLEPINYYFAVQKGKATVLPMMFVMTQSDGGEGIESHFDVEALAASDLTRLTAQLQQVLGVSHGQLLTASTL